MLVSFYHWLDWCIGNWSNDWFIWFDISRCETWVLTPNLRFLDNVKWDPQGVNLLLQKFGILDQRQTIPKWMQRLIMDPMDDVIAHLVKRNLAISSRKWNWSLEKYLYIFWKYIYVKKSDFFLTMTVFLSTVFVQLCMNFIFSCQSCLRIALILRNVYCDNARLC